MFKDLVKANRSYRGFDETRKITKEELLEFVDCARLAPSGANGQPFHYYLAWEKDEVEKIQPVTKWAAALPKIELPHEGMCPTAFIIICQDAKDSLQGHRTDLGIVAQTILLAATDVGLSGCMIGNFNPNEMQSVIGLDESFVPILTIALGKGKENIVLTEIECGESTKYYRDSDDVHYVPKRKLEDIVLSKK